MQQEQRPSLSPFLDNLYHQALDYAEVYRLPETFTWYVIGSAWHTVSMSSSMIPDYLDHMRTEFSDIRIMLSKVDT